MGAFDQKVLTVNDPTPIGAVVSAIGAPNTNYLQLNGQSIRKSDYPQLAGVGGPLANDPYRWEGSSFLTTKTPTGGAFDTGACNRENQLGYGGPEGAKKFWAITKTAANDTYVNSSPDGVTWTEAYIQTSNGGYYTMANGLIWCGGSINLYVLYGGHSTNGRQIFTSPDLITWTNRYNEGSGNRQIHHGSFDGNSKIALITDGTSAAAGAVHYSSNGTSWSITVLPDDQTAAHTAAAYVAYFPSFGIWVGLYTAGWISALGSSAHIVVTSTDAITWTIRIQLSGSEYGYGRKVAQIGNRLVVIPYQNATGANRTVRFSTSSNGLTWGYSTGAGTSSGTVSDIASNGSLAVVVQGDSGTGANYLAYTRDGVIYQRCNMGSIPGNSLPATGYSSSLRVTYDGQKFIAAVNVLLAGYSAGSSYVLMYSYDGITFNVIEGASEYPGFGFVQAVSNGTTIVGITFVPDIRTTIPNYNTATSVFLPNRNNNGISYYVRAKQC
jgi:hypothetical protein